MGGGVTEGQVTVRKEERNLPLEIHLALTCAISRESGI